MTQGWYCNLRGQKVNGLVEKRLINSFLFPFLAKREKQRTEYIMAKLQLQQLVEEFYQRFSMTYKELRLKHCKQLERLKMANAASANGEKPLNVTNGEWV